MISPSIQVAGPAFGRLSTRFASAASCARSVTRRSHTPPIRGVTRDEKTESSHNSATASHLLEQNFERVGKSGHSEMVNKICARRAGEAFGTGRLEVARGAMRMMDQYGEPRTLSMRVGRAPVTQVTHNLASRASLSGARPPRFCTWTFWHDVRFTR